MVLQLLAACKPAKTDVQEQQAQPTQADEAHQPAASLTENTDHLVKVKLSAVKLWVQLFVWMPP